MAIKCEISTKHCHHLKEETFKGSKIHNIRYILHIITYIHYICYLLCMFICLCRYKIFFNYLFFFNNACVWKIQCSNMELFLVIAPWQKESNQCHSYAADFPWLFGMHRVIVIASSGVPDGKLTPKALVSLSPSPG